MLKAVHIHIWNLGQEQRENASDSVSLNARSGTLGYVDCCALIIASSSSRVRCRYASRIFGTFVCAVGEYTNRCSIREQLAYLMDIIACSARQIPFLAQPVPFDLH